MTIEIWLGAGAENLQLFFILQKLFEDCIIVVCV